ncbi:scarecrow-like protein 14 [Malania oleifera]|uniref:scarecrow-like protein 14 n=1 Tax=Malania oleifera TaxID=397392 RepID=UPI0025AEB575|nr:scarecrow-like protein 14 [Malania oleifera]
MDFPSLPSEQDPGYLVLPSTLRPPEAHSEDDRDFSDATLECIRHMLMEEDTEQRSGAFLDPLALRDAERSFYEVLGIKYPPSPSPNQRPILRNPDDDGSTATNGACDSAFQSTSKMPFSFPDGKNGSSCATTCSSVSTLLFPNISCVVESTKLQFRKGVQEASKCLPFENHSAVDSGTRRLPAVSQDYTSEVGEGDRMRTGTEGRKEPQRRDADIEEARSKKQSTFRGEEEDELSEMFDRVLLCFEDPKKPVVCASRKVLQNGPTSGLSSRKEKQNRMEGGHLRKLLTLCARAIAVDDHWSVITHLNEIRQHSSPSGDGAQRIAHYFSKGLEARLTGTGAQIYANPSPKRLLSAAELLEAIASIVLACPIKQINFCFANHCILNLAGRASTVHVIVVGVSYGFQWPMLIQDLSVRAGGPPGLRITGIEFPQPGFLPKIVAENTGRRLAKYCEHFHVPFEYNVVVQRWETIQIEELKIDKSELVVVSCMFGFENLLDEIDVANCPMNSVYNLIRKINPHIFIHGIINAHCNQPIFTTRFQRALSYYSSKFDMLDTILVRESQERFLFEKYIFGQQIMNIVACEGSNRVFRPQTYKYWQIQNMAAGFRQLPLDRVLMMTMRAKMKSGYHQNFFIDEDGHWMLQGWKRRILTAVSCWIPTFEC